MFPYPCPPHFPKYIADFPKEERTLKTVPVTKEQFPVFHRLLTDYYRDGEDAQTPQEELDGFIEMLFELCTEGAVSGCIAYEKDALGFIIYGLDTKDFPFSNKPGCGTILEIGVVPSARGRRLGQNTRKIRRRGDGLRKILRLRLRTRGELLEKMLVPRHRRNRIKRTENLRKDADGRIF